MTEEEVLKKISGETFLFYGRPKIGKSSLAAQFPNPVFIATEPGLRYVQKDYGLDNKRIKEVFNWSEFIELSQKFDGDTTYSTRIIDTLDELWLMCVNHVCARFDKEHPSEIGSQGKGWSICRDEFKGGLRKIRKAADVFIMIGHATMKEVGPKDGKYTYVALNLPGKALEASMAYVDHILYLAPGKEEGERFIYTDGTKHFEAGSRNADLASKRKIKLTFNELIESM